MRAIHSHLGDTDPKAERGALLVALAAHHGAVHGPNGVRWETFLNEAKPAIAVIDSELVDWLGKVEDHLQRDVPAVELADALGLQDGVTGYMYHTVPLALYCWLRHPHDFRRAVEEVITLGGDADSTGAIVGGLAGATLGAGSIPEAWINGLLEWPRSVRWMRELARRMERQFSVADGAAVAQALSLFWPGLAPRNGLFMVIVLLHGFRRLLPPY